MYVAGVSVQLQLDGIYSYSEASIILCSLNF